MRQVLRRTLPTLAVGMLLAGCSTSTVVGTASPGPGAPVDVSAEEFPITGAADNEIDRLSRNALDDLETFWEQAYPEFFGGEYQPLQGGYFSVDSQNIDESAYPETGVGCAGEYIPPDAVAGNAFFYGGCDIIVYDRALLQALSDKYDARFLGPVVMAHEFGHAMQFRFGGLDASQIIVETQADCLAGAFTRWVVDGNAEHSSVRSPDLDNVIRGFLELRDPVGSDPTDESAHGSYFDRVSGFQSGFESGVASCRDDFGTDRLFTAAEFTPEEYENEGNAAYDDIVEWITATLPAFWDTVFPSAFGSDFQEPTVEPFDTTAPDCGDMGAEDRDLGYCQSDTTVYYDQVELTQPAYEIGDFAVGTAISLPYALAARDQAELSIDDGAATRSAVCLSGWYTAQWFNGAFQDVLPDVAISPGDVDEAVIFLLQYGLDPKVFPNVDSTGFELVDAFRDGFLQGGSACDIGV
jgi:predicted metalloprotease